MKSVKMFGKSVPLIAIVMVSILAVGTFAATLTYYGMIGSTSTVDQSVLVDGAGYAPPLVETFVTTGGNTVAKLHKLENTAEVLAWLVVEATYPSEVSVRYDTEIIDDKSQFATPPETLMGARSNEVVAFENPSCTLNELFAGDGLQYTYTILAGTGDAPIIAVIDLQDGRHIALFPGWGARTGTHTLQFSETVAYDSGGNNYVDFALYPADYSSWLYGSGPSYGSFATIKAATTLLDGTEDVIRISIQHQAAGTMEEDRLDSLSIGSAVHEFLQIVEGVSFPLGAGQEAYFVIRYTFDANASGTIVITTEVRPAP